jgi:hypothetical protein
VRLLRARNFPSVRKPYRKKGCRNRQGERVPLTDRVTHLSLTLPRISLSSGAHAVLLPLRPMLIDCIECSFGDDQVDMAGPSSADRRRCLFYDENRRRGAAMPAYLRGVSTSANL